LSQQSALATCSYRLVYRLANGRPRSSVARALAGRGGTGAEIEPQVPGIELKQEKTGSLC